MIANANAKSMDKRHWSSIKNRCKFFASSQGFDGSELFPIDEYNLAWGMYDYYEHTKGFSIADLKRYYRDEPTHKEHAP